MAVAARYLNRELFWVFVVVVVVLLTVALGGRFIGYLQDAALGKYAAESLLTIMWMRLPDFLQQLLPFAYYISLLLTIGRVHAEQEMAVLQGAGIGPGRLLIWLAPGSIALTILVAFLSLSQTPANNALLEEFFDEQRANQEFDATSPGVFRTYQRGSRVTYAESVSEDRRILDHVFMSERRADNANITVWADTGTQYVDAETGSRFLLLKDGVRYEGRIGERDYRVTQFATMGQRLAVVEPAARGVEVDSVPTATLMRNSGAEYSAELHWRYALPVLTLVGTFLAVGLARVKPRQGRFAQVVPGVLIFVAYYLLLVMIQNAMRAGSWPLGVGLWPIHALFGLVGSVLIYAVARPAKA
ncbi:MAG: LPS export ABC transporter permease LptF [Gammaproteobacteria bacterium]|nr:LPS export ABC transporter permease LptF [Gammaproteobacteria bacterium]